MLKKSCVALTTFAAVFFVCLPPCRLVVPLSDLLGLQNLFPRLPLWQWDPWLSLFVDPSGDAARANRLFIMRPEQEANPGVSGTLDVEK